MRKKRKIVWICYLSVAYKCNSDHPCASLMQRPGLSSISKKSVPIPTMSVEWTDNGVYDDWANMGADEWLVGLRVVCV